MDPPREGRGPQKEGAERPTMRNVRAVLEERNQRFLSRRSEFEPQVHHQIARLFSDYQPPLYARLRGFNRAQTLRLAESTVLSLVAVNGRRLEDSETQALTEHFLSSVHNLLAWKWVMTGAAAYMTYRGRGTFRFPFFKPQFVTGGRAQYYSPVGRGPGFRAGWHALRFGAYYVTFWVLAEPVFQGLNFMRQRGEMERDGRLRALMREGKAQGATLLSGEPETSGQIGKTWDSAAREEALQHQQQERQQQQQQQQQQSNQGEDEQHASWASMPTPPTAQQPYQPSSSPWDSPSSDDLDDASPVAAPSSSAGGDKAGSAWDRIRQQSQHQANQQQQRRGQQSWERPQSESFSEDRDRDRDRDSHRESAQRDFDRLLEQERSTEERGAWRR